MYLKEKETSSMLSRKDIIILFNKFNCIKTSQYFPKPYEPFGGNINVKVDLSNYTKKSNLKSSTGIDTFKLDAIMI